MAIINKDFRLKNGLVVEGTNATVNGNQILTENASDQYIIDLIGGETLVTSVNSTQLEVVNGELSVKSGVFDAYGDASAVAQDLSDHASDTSTHGVTGDIVGTTDSQSLSNKKFLGATYFQSGGGAGGTGNYVDVDNSTGKLTVRSGYALDLTSQGLVRVVSNGNDIVLDADGDVYLGSVAAGNNVATQGDLDALGTRDNTVNTLVLRDGFGNFAAGQIDLDSKLTAPDVRLGDAGRIYDNNGNLSIDANNVNDLTLGADNAVVISTGTYVEITANDGNINLNTNNSAYVNNDQIVTVSANQTLTNKTIGDELAFGDGGSFISEANGVGSGDLQVVANNDLTLRTYNGDIVLNPDGNAYISSSSAGNEIATQSYVDNAVAGLNWKQAVNLLWDDANATTDGAVGTLVIDGHAALTSSNNGYRILITNGANAGIWEYQEGGTGWTLTRPADADTYQELIGAAVYVMEGTQYGSTSWVQGDHYLTGFTGQDWTQFSGQGSVTAGTGIIVNGLEVSVDTDVIATQSDLSTGLGLKQDELTAGEGIEISTVNTIPNTIQVKTGNGVTVLSPYGITIDRNTVDTWYDASGAAATAEDNANTYTDTQLQSYTPTSSLESIIDGYGFAYTSEIPTSTDGLSEGTNNLYYTDARAEDAAGYLLKNATTTNISIDYNGTNLTITAENGVADSTTDDLDEGSINKYFTDQRVIDAVAGSDITPNTVTIDTYRKEEATQQYVATPSTVNVHSLPAGFESAKYLVRVVGNVDGVKHSQVSEILLTTDGNNNIAITEYGTISTATGNLATFSASYSGGAYNLTATTVVNGVEIIAAATMLSWAD